MGKRIHNFNAGPAALPLPVLEEIQKEFVDYRGSGMSITEVSHRSEWFDDVINEAGERARRLLNLSDEFKVLFPDCEPGAMPPVGSLYDMRVFVDEMIHFFPLAVSTTPSKKFDLPTKSAI